MLETHLDSPITRRRLRKGPAADHIDAFADWLHLHGYKPTSIDTLLRSLAGWTDWMLVAGFTAKEFVAGLTHASWQLRRSGAFVTAVDPITIR